MNETKLCNLIDQLKELQYSIGEDEGHYERARIVINLLTERLRDFVTENEIERILDNLDWEIYDNEN